MKIKQHPLCPLQRGTKSKIKNFNKPSLLLCICCAPCATQSIEKLLEDYEITLLYANSNIFPEEEYKKRLNNTEKLAEIYNLPHIEAEYDHQAWKDFIKGLEDEPEKGKRCEKCFEFNLSAGAKFAAENNFDFFTTTLTISPHKSSETIFAVGKNFDKFLPIGFKKNNGFKKSLELSRKHNLYRQNYCGCEFSIR